MIQGQKSQNFPRYLSQSTRQTDRPSDSTALLDVLVQVKIEDSEFRNLIDYVNRNRGQNCGQNCGRYRSHTSNVYFAGV